MHTLEQTMRLAKRGTLSKAELYKRMLAASKVFQTVGVSEAQAFSKFCQTDEGRELLAIEKSLPGGDIAPQRPTYVNKNAGDGSLWDRLVRATAKSQGLTYSKAVDVCLSTEEGKVAFNEQRKHDLIHKSGFTKADMQCFEGAETIRKAAGDDVPGTPHKHEFEVEVDRILQANPKMSRSKAMDAAAKSNPDAWADYKKLGGGRQLPRQAVGTQSTQPGNEDYPEEPTSQRTPTPRPPQWVGNQSHNYPGNNPARSPFRPSGEPQIKGFWERQSPNARSDYVRMLRKNAGMSEADALSVLEGL
jgi:hypothetical protein